VVSFPHISPLKPCKHLSSPPYVLHALPHPFFFISKPELYLVSRTKQKAACCEIPRISDEK
jgi:hypothetical protein